MSYPNIIHQSHAPYSYPAILPNPEKLYVVTAISNPARYRSRYRLYHAFENMVANSGAILYTAELATGNRPFEVTKAGNPRHIQVRCEHELWHKENLLNVAISRLPAEAKYIAWIDADVNFARPDWVQETLQQLQHYDFVQMFSQVVDLGPDFEILHTALSWTESIRLGLPLKDVNTKKSGAVDHSYIGLNGPRNELIKGAWHSGFAWAARRESLDKVGGLIDLAILGSADKYMAAGLFGKMDHVILNAFTYQHKQVMFEWERRAERFIRHNVGQVDGTIFHSFHGAKINRRYVKRWKILVDQQYNPLTDVKRDCQGILQLHDDGSARMLRLRDELRNYFRSRNEDDISLYES